MRELNRLGVTSASDAGGGGHHYPEDYDAIKDLASRRETTVRVAYSMFTNNPGKELDDFKLWDTMTAFGDGDDRLTVNGIGEVITYSAYDFENFVQPRPEIAEKGLNDLREVLGWLVQHRWPVRLHATYDESISKYLNVFEDINREFPFDGLHWFFDHCETISQKSIDRVAALGGGIAVQDRMAFAGERFVERYGQDAAATPTPPIKATTSRPACRSARGPTRPGLLRTTLGLAVLVGDRTHRRRLRTSVDREEPTRPNGGAAAVHPGERLVLSRR